MLADLDEGYLFGFGSALMDVTAAVTDDFLEKYDLPKDVSILARPEHEGLIEDMGEEFDIEYTPGGSTQNTMRYISWMLGVNIAHVTVFCSVVGDDYFGKLMEKAVKLDRVKLIYSRDKNKPTGQCAVLVTDGGKARTTVAYVGASKRMDKNELLRQWCYVEAAKMYFMSGHELALSFDAAMAIAKQTVKDEYEPKILAFNLAAPYVTEKYFYQLGEVMPYVDLFFANEMQARAFAKMRGWKSTDVKEIALRIANEPKVSKAFRLVIVTQGPKPVIVAKALDPGVREYEVPAIPDDKFVDANAAGDAFNGGFLSQWIQKKPMEICVKAGIYCASEAIQQLGANLPRHQHKFVSE